MSSRAAKILALAISKNNQNTDNSNDVAVENTGKANYRNLPGTSKQYLQNIDISENEDVILPDFEASESSFHPSGSTSSSSVNVQNDVETFPQKRKKNINKWKKNIRKTKRLAGEAYIGFRNVERAARPMLPSPCITKPKHISCNSITEDYRKILYTEYRNFSSINDQRQFLVNHIVQKPKKRTTRNIVESRRMNTCVYQLSVNGEMKIVCRNFFMATFNITDALMRSALSKINPQGILEKDKRGKHIPHNKLNERDVTFLKNHITSFPAMESHYCRKSTQKKYLDATLNIKIMYTMYVATCKNESLKPASLEKYRSIFRTFNIGFFKPKKDQCRKCLNYKTLAAEDKETQEEIFQEHMAKKKQAREERDKDKEVAQQDKNVLAFNFDLQAVLSTPKGPAGQIFYMRKLAVYNLTIYNLGNQDVKCYLWDETQGKRGANEISSCVFNFIKIHDGIKYIRMMSDGCGGQQKNSIFATMCLKLLADHNTIEVIDHKFFESGHTEMECDSIHSKIEQKSKNVPVYKPEGWAQIIRSARSNPRPYEVNHLDYDAFYDFKAIAERSNMKEIPWHNVCWLRYKRDNPKKMYYKTTFEIDTFHEVEIKLKRGKKLCELKKCYKSDLPISMAKYKDLMKMCNDFTIEKVHHLFYKSLKTDKSVEDRLAEPAIDELSEYEDN